MFNLKWNQYYRTKEELEKDLNIIFQGEGWYTKNNSIRLILEFTDGLYVVYTFEENPVVEMQRIIDLPTYKN